MDLARESERLARTSAGWFEVAHAVELLGYASCVVGEPEAAPPSLAESLRLYLKLGYPPCAAHNLEHAAHWAVLVGRLEEAAEIFGFAQRLRELTGDRPRPWEGDVLEELEAALREGLDPDRLERLLELGRSLEFEKGMARAIAVLDPRSSSPEDDRER